jgi:hypothetical protein
VYAKLAHGVRLGPIAGGPSGFYGIFLDGTAIAVGARMIAIPLRLALVSNAAGADAVVFFADDYPLEEARGAVAGLSVRLIVIVTADVSAFNACRKERASDERIVVLPRPAWGWVLLEAIRSARPSMEH